MIPVKVQCGCGQRYAFDVEPVAGRMPYPVACPICGADGTAAAEEIIARSIPSPVVATPVARLAAAPVATLQAAPVAALRAAPVTLAVPVAAPARPSGSLVSSILQTDRSKAEAEARSKILWGDPPEEVLKFVLMQGLPTQDAVALVQSLVKERMATLRSLGIQKIVGGIALVCVPIAAWFVFMRVGVLPLKLFAVTVMIGLYGAYLALKGFFMVFLPKMESGDIADK